MLKNAYLATTGPGTGKSALALGLMSFLQREIESVGYFRPIARPGPDKGSPPDQSTELIRSVFALTDDPRDMVGVTDDRGGQQGGKQNKRSNEIHLEKSE